MTPLYSSPLATSTPSGEKATAATQKVWPESNDNPYSEALFRTLKHTPAYPRMPFASIETMRTWVDRFVAWYNGQHRHSAIRYVTPDERHFAREEHILARRRDLHERARRRRPERWSRATRNWNPVEIVLLNPEPLSRELRAA